MYERTLIELKHNGNTIKVWLSDYSRGDLNLLNVSVDNVMLMSENIQAEF